MILRNYITDAWQVVNAASEGRLISIDAQEVVHALDPSLWVSYRQLATAPMLAGGTPSNPVIMFALDAAEAGHAAVAAAAGVVEVNETNRAAVAQMLSENGKTLGSGDVLTAAVTAIRGT
jgi:ABC-type transport system involved in cytochrome bd biosynthesis fused ATPase/permease subunit